jgi:hypothetical protein
MPSGGLERKPRSGRKAPQAKDIVKDLRGTVRDQAAVPHATR